MHAVPTYAVKENKGMHWLDTMQSAEMSVRLGVDWVRVQCPLCQAILSGCQGSLMAFNVTTHSGSRLLY